MNTHDIELPPLPYPNEVMSNDAQNAEKMYSEGTLRKYARAAIEADRQRTAELLKNPVHVHTNMCRGIIAPITFDMLAHVLGEKATVAWLNNRKRRGEPVSTHNVHRGAESLPCYCPGELDHSIGKETQLAEPVKVLSNAQAYELWTEIVGKYSTLSGQVPAFARAVLARYGQPAVSGGSVPDGRKLVPVEPTPEMVDAALRLQAATGTEFADEPHHDEIYRAMLFAAPAVPVEGQPK